MKQHNTNLSLLPGVIGICLLGMLVCFLTACGGKKNNTRAQKKIEITVTGLDGNGVAEKKITNDLMGMEGVKTISFNYLNNQVVVLFDTTQVTQSAIITKILQSNDGRHKVIDVKTNHEPQKKDPVIPPTPLEDIKDDTGDPYKNNG
jgi:copper chaperone CopZ